MTQKQVHRRSCLLLLLLMLTGCSRHTVNVPPAVLPDDPPAETGIQMPETDPSTLPDGGDEPADGHAVYTFGQPVEESPAVEDSWFDDAVFLGDSRTEGLQLYSGLKSGAYFWEWGMSVFHTDDHRKIVVDGQNLTMLEALATGTWNKVYIMIGVNDLGYPADSYRTALAELVDQVQAIQPEAVVYLQTMPPVNEGKAQESKIAYYVNNANLDLFNQAIVQIAKEKQVALVDVASCLRSSQGILAEDMTSDGVHLRKAGYQTCLDYLKCHTLDQAGYQAAREAGQTGGENQ